jgi:formate hydrogenlyase subunit 3/multisubunit Na+/H+ antiporter MnhD subunit
MLLVGFLVFGLILETSDENLISKNKDTFKHTLAINSLAAVGSLFAIVLHSDLSPAPGVNFELGIKNNFSVNFEIDLNNIFFLILPVEGEIGLRKP